MLAQCWNVGTACVHSLSISRATVVLLAALHDMPDCLTVAQLDYTEEVGDRFIVTGRVGIYKHIRFTAADDSDMDMVPDAAAKRLKTEHADAAAADVCPAVQRPCMDLDLHDDMIKALGHRSTSIFVRRTFFMF